MGPETDPLDGERRAAERRLARKLYRYWEPQFRAVRAQLEAQRVELLAAQAEAEELRSGGAGERAKEIGVTLDWGEEAARMEAEIGPELDAIIAAAGAQVAQELKRMGLALSWEVYDQAAAQFAEMYRYTLIKDLTDTSREQLGKVISRWIQTDEDFADLVERVRRVIPPNPYKVLRDRAVLVAQTETTRVYAESRIAGFEAAGLTQARWRTNMDELVCPICAPLGLANGGEGAVGTVKGGFVHPETGMVVKRPPAHVGCVLPGNVAAVPGLLAAAQSFYRGRGVEIETAGGRRLTVTENHPILTAQGWVAAQFIGEGDQVVAHRDPVKLASSLNPYYDYTPAPVEQIFGALQETRGMITVRMPVAAEDLHGDGVGVEGEIEIVGPDRELMLDRPTDTLQIVAQRVFAAPGYVVLDEQAADRGTRDAVLLGEFLHRFASQIALDDVVGIREFDFAGHVYDLQSEPYALYAVNGIIAQNCRCWIVEDTEELSGLLEQQTASEPQDTERADA